MVYAVQATVGFRNTARRNAVMNNVQTRLQQNVPFGTVVLFPRTRLGTGDPGFELTVRFQTKAEQQAFWSVLQAAFGQGVNGPVTGSSAWTHDCPHDQPNPPACAFDEQLAF